MANAPSPNQPLVHLEGVDKTYHQEGMPLRVLNGVDLRIDAGEMVAIVGRSGAGKSTLLHLIGTLDLPDAGRVTIEGQDVMKLSSDALARFRNRKIGFVFQFHHLLPDFTAEENVAMPSLLHGAMKRPAALKRAADLLAEVGLAERRGHRPSELSGGEQQRVAIARALMMEPTLVLADEPTGNLDTATSETVHELIFDLNARHGTTFAIVTHSVELAGRMPRVLTMKDGQIADDAAPNAHGAEAAADLDPPSADG